MLCKAAKPKTKAYKISDAQGLYLAVMPTGSKYWNLKYRFQGKERKASLGVYPETGLAEARQKRENIKLEIKQGLDPRLVSLAAKQTAAFSSAQTFELIAMEWFEVNKPIWNPRYAATVLHRLEKYVFGQLGQYPITQLTPVIILACLKKIDNTAPEMARRIKKLY